MNIISSDMMMSMGLLVGIVRRMHLLELSINTVLLSNNTTVRFPDWDYFMSPHLSVDKVSHCWVISLVGSFLTTWLSSRERSPFNVPTASQRADFIIAASLIRSSVLAVMNIGSNDSLFLRLKNFTPYCSQTIRWSSNSSIALLLYGLHGSHSKLR